MHVMCANTFGAIVLKPRFKIDAVIMIICSCSARDWDGKDYLRIIPRVVLVEDPRLLKGPL